MEEELARLSYRLTMAVGMVGGHCALSAYGTWVEKIGGPLGKCWSAIPQACPALELLLFLEGTGCWG